MIKCIVVDDEKEHRDYLKMMIETNFADVRLIGSAKSVEEGIQLINETEFDLLFLDVQMPPLTGFDLLKAITRKDFEVVFTTAYDQYAIEAIRFSALDYLLKPYSADDLKNAFIRYSEKAGNLFTHHKIENLLHNINPVNSKKRIGLSDKNGIEFFDIDTIVYCQSENVYTTFFFENKKEVVTSKPIKEYEKELQPYNFFRIHQSYLINLKKVKKYFRGDGGQAKMSNDAVLDVARNKKDSFLQKLSEL